MSERPKIAVIVNPAAHKGGAARRWPAIQAELVPASRPLRAALHRGAGPRDASRPVGAGRGRAALRGGGRRRHGERDPERPARAVGPSQRARCRALSRAGRHRQRTLPRARPSRPSGARLRRRGGRGHARHRSAARALQRARWPTGRSLRLSHRVAGRGRHHQPPHLAVALAEEAGRDRLSPDDASRDPGLSPPRRRHHHRRRGPTARVACSPRWSPTPRMAAAA